MTIIKRELQRGLELSEKIMSGKRPWSDLFIKHTFFTAGYKYYICVVAASKSKEAHKVWSGYVESKVRMLVQRIETHASIALAHPFTKGYERKHRCTSDEEVAMVQEGSLDFLVTDSEEADVSDAGTKVIGALATHTGNGDSKPEDETESSIKQENGALGQVNGATTKKQDQAPSANSKPQTETETETDSTPQAPKPMNIYTTTHYIGLELAEGMYS